MYYFEDAVAEEPRLPGCAEYWAKRSSIFPRRTTRAMPGDARVHGKISKEMAETIRSFTQPLLRTRSTPARKKRSRTQRPLARKYNAPILIHVAEMKKELDDSRAQNGTTPVQYLDKIGILGPDVVAAHCIYVDETDRKILAQRKSRVCAQSVPAT